MHVFMTEWKRLITSPGLIIGIAILVLAGIVGSTEAVSYVREYIRYDENLNFLLIFQAVLNSEIFMAGIALIGPLSYAAVYLEEQRSRFVVYSLPRCGWNRYLGSKLTAVALSGGISVAVSLVLLFCYSMLAAGQMKVPGMWNTLLMSLPTYCLGGCLYAVTGGCFAAVMRNKYMAYASPFILYYILTAFQKRYYTKLYILSPEEWMLSRYLNRSTGIIILIFLLCVVSVSYMAVMRKRIRNG